jgi:hypothetical protein
MAASVTPNAKALLVSIVDPDGAFVWSANMFCGCVTKVVVDCRQLIGPVI